VKGVLAGDRIVCPWHAACFNACSGDIEDGPVLDAIPVFSVQVTTPKKDIYVNLPTEMVKGVTPSMVAKKGSDSRAFVIIGAGAAGATAIETLRQEGFTGRIVVVAKEARLPYDRTKLSKNMAVELDEILLRPKSFYETHGVELIQGVAVEKLDPSSKTLSLSNGSKLEYEKVLCASGGPARTFRPSEGFSIEGSTLGNIFPVKTIEDSKAVEGVLASAGVNIPIVVLGSSFIGMETAAYLLANRKCTNVTVIGMEEQPFSRVLGNEIGLVMRRLHESKGCKFIMNAVASKFNGDSSSKKVASITLKDGSTIPAQLVILGAGIIPALEYLKGVPSISLLDKAPGGVIVDDTMKVTEHVYAAGDIAYFPYKFASNPASPFVRIEHWDVAMDQARTAAKNMLGQNVKYSCVPFFWTAQYGKSVRYAGYASKTNNIIYHGTLSGDSPSFVAYFIVDDVIAAVATFMKDPYAVAALELMRLNALPSISTLKNTPEGKIFDLEAHLREVTTKK
jgi:apoptosis-inducing factor 3